MTVRVFKSSDAGAPPLRGNTPGDLLAVLEACLVTGFGSKAAAGWTKPFSTASVAVFKQGIGSNGMHMRVDDSMLQTAANARAARIVGYENMSDINTGTPSAFPSTSQLSGGLWWYTMNTGSEAWGARDVARPWMVLADESFLWLYIGSTVASGAALNSTDYRELYFFGDINAYGSADVFATVLSGATVSSGSSSSTYGYNFGGSSVFPMAGGTSSVGNLSPGFFIARKSDGVTTSASAGHHADYVKSGGNWWVPSSAAYGLSFPNSSDGAMVVSPVYVHDPASSSAVLRGVLPGIWCPCHRLQSMNTGDEFDGQGALAGKRLMVLNIIGAVVFIEISDTWR